MIFLSGLPPSASPKYDPHMHGIRSIIKLHIYQVSGPDLHN